MDNEVSLTPYTQNRAIPKILGILNIVFAALMLMGGLCQLGLTAASPAMSKAMKDLEAKQKEQMEAQSKEAMKQLDQQEKEAKTEDDKAEIREVRKAAAAAPKAVQVPMIDIMKFTRDKRLASWTWTELLTGLAGNIAMLTAGIGLVLFKPWGRVLAMWVAGIKIIRLAIIYGYAAIVIVPPFSKLLGEEVGKMMMQQQQAMGRPGAPGLGPEFFIKTYTITYTVLAIGMIVVGSIYPIISLWLLSRPSAKAACSATTSKPKQTDTW